MNRLKTKLYWHAGMANLQMVAELGDHRNWYMTLRMLLGRFKTTCLSTLYFTTITVYFLSPKQAEL